MHQGISKLLAKYCTDLAQHDLCDLQAVQSLAEEKQQLQERLLQAHAFISCLQQHTGWSATPKAAASGQQQQRPTLLQTPSDASAAAAGAATAVTPEFSSTGSNRATAGGLVLALPAPAAADTVRPAPGAAVAGQRSAEGDGCPASFATPPAIGHSNPLFDLPATPGSQLMSGEPGAAHAATAVVPHGQMTWPQDPPSPILAAATRSTAVGEHRQRVQHSAATHELQDVHQEQLGLREEISRAKSALADIAGQLRASIGAAAVSKASSASIGGSIVGGCGRAATAGASSRVNKAMTTPASTSSSGSHRQGPLQATASAARSSDSRSSTGTAATASHGSRTKGSAGRIHGPCKLQELQKAAAAVKSVSAARSSSSSKGSMIATKATSDLGSVGRAAAEAAGAPSASAGQHICSKHCDELSDSCSNASSSPGQSSGNSASAPAANASAAGPGLVFSAAASGERPSASNVKGAAPGAASGSGKGSISLDQLIADAETISLEYGMSPGGPATGTPAAAAVEAASAAQATSTPAAHSCLAVAGVAGFTPDQQVPGSGLQQHFAFVARPVSQLVTPGSAASSAGAGRLVPVNMAWLTQRQLEGTPASAVVNNPQPDDMQSCIRPGRGSHAPLPGPQQQQATPAAPTPIGLERVASNTMLDALDTAAAGLQSQQQQQAFGQQQQLLLPDATGSVCATEDAATVCGSSVQQQKAVTPGSIAAAAPDAGASGLLLSGSRAGTGSVLITLQQQQQGSTEGGASACSSAPVTPSGAVAAACTPPAPLSSPPSALKKAAAALLSSISPAGLMTAATPEGQGPTGAMAAAAAAAGLSPQLLQHLTPEWLRSLKRKCKQESEQLQLLRRQMGLATPEVDVSPQDQQLLQVLPSLPQQQPLDTAVCAAGPGEESLSCAAAAAASVACDSISTACLDDTRLGAADGSCDQGSGAEAVELSMQQDDGMMGTTAACSSMNSRAGAAAGLTGSSSSLGLLSSRSSIDRLRRRAIMAQANAASASPLPLDQDAVTAGSAALDVCLPAALTAASQVGYAAADTASMDDQLDRCSSAGSLAEYMRQHSLRDDSAPVSRTSSITPGMYPARPECPTPGSLYSDIADAVGSADEALLGRDAPVSPDMLLAGLRSSRAAARQLQHQLLQQLEKTTSMPSVLSRQHEAALRAVAPALHRTNSAAAAVAAADAGTHSAEESSDSRCDSVALEASTQLIVAPQVAPHAAGSQAEMDPAAPGLAADAAAQARGSTYSSSTGSRQARPLHQQMSRLMEGEQQAAASPATPGAALNAGAESRLLSPSMQLQLVFDGEGSGDEASTAEVGNLEQQPEHVQEVDDFNMQQQPEQCPSGTDLNSCSKFLPLQQVHQQQGQQQLPVLSSASPQASDSSSCMLPLGVAAKAQPAADSAVAAQSPPVSVLSATPGSAVPQASVRAHQLSGVSAGTFTASTPLGVYDGSEPLSCARAPAMVPAASAADGARHVCELTSAIPAICGAANAAAAGGARSVSTRLQAATQGQGLTGGAASRSHSSSPSCSRAISEGGPSLGSWAAAGTPAAAQADATAAAQSGATQNSTLLGSGTSPGHAQQQQQDDARALPILLGKSPSTKPQQPRTQTQGYSSTPASTASKMSAAGATASSASITSGSCITSAPTPHLSLGRSPGSEVESAHAPAGSMEATGSVADAGTTVTAAAGSCKSDDAGVEAVNTAAAAAAAIAAAFAAPKAVESAAPAVSSTTWGSGSCMFATPAVEFNSLGGAYSCYSEGSDGQVYYTGLQHSSHSSMHVATTAASSGGGAAGQDQSAQTAGGGPEVAFAGFRVAERYHTEDEGISSPVASTRAAFGKAAEVGGMNHGAAAPVVTATAQKKLLQQLLASPGDDGASEASPESPLAAEEPSLPDTTTAHSALPAPGAAAALTVQLAGVGAEEPGVGAVLSPTLSELGFVAASTSADVATAKRLQQEQQQQELRQGKSRAVAADLDGLSFEQRLDLLCAEDAYSSEGSPVQSLGAAAGGTSSGAGGSSSKWLGPSSNGGGGTHSAEGTSTQEDEAALPGAPGLQGSMACCATQTSPLPVGFASTSQDWVRSGMFSHHTAVPSQHSFEAAPTVGHIMGGMHVHMCADMPRVVI